jgi:lysophospholipase
MTNEERLSRLSPTRARRFLRNLACAAALSAATAAGAQALQLTTEAALKEPPVQSAIEAFWTDRGVGSTLVGQGGLKLALRRFLQPDRATERGAIVVVSGRTESMLKYKELVYDLYRNGWSVYIHDHRGQGLSDREPAVRDQPQKGHVERFDDYVADLDAVLGTQVLPAGHARRVLLAHSMGGGITARYLQSGRPSVKKVDAAVLSSPMLEIVGLVPGLSAEIFSCYLAHAAVALGAGADWHWGGGPYVPVDVQQNELTSSPVRTERMIDQERAAPATQLGSPTWGWIARSCDAAKATRVEAAKITTPLLVTIAGQDQIVLNHGAIQLCQRLAARGAGCGGPAGGPVLIEGARHEMLIERDALRSQVLGRALGFLDQAAR